jgi:hypothetical protein
MISEKKAAWQIGGKNQFFEGRIQKAAGSERYPNHENCDEKCRFGRGSCHGYRPHKGTSIQQTTTEADPEIAAPRKRRKGTRRTTAPSVSSGAIVRIVLARAQRFWYAARSFP